MAFSPVLTIVLFILSALLTHLFCKVCNRSRWMDIPNERSAHTRPVPKGAGVVFMLLLILYAVSAYYSNEMSLQLTAALALGVPAGLLGLADDFFNLPIYPRLFVQSLIVGGVLFIYGGIETLALPWGMAVLGLWGYVLAFIAFLWLFNLFNFMDGMDGLASGEVIFVLGAVIFIGSPSLPADVVNLSLALIVILAGFMLFNFHPASVFMGDAGSNLLACILIVILMEAQSDGSLSLWTWGILLGLFVCDSTYTLVYRLFSGQVWYHPHKSHGYQRLMGHFENHRKVFIILMAINLLWLLPLAWLAENKGAWGVYILILAYSPLLAMNVCLKAGKAVIPSAVSMDVGLE